MVLDDTIDAYAPRRGGSLGIWRIMATGAALIALALFLTVSLLSWHVADPSFSHATDATARNLMGFAGAATADLVMQFLGLGCVAVVALLLIPGINHLRRRRFRHVLRQTGYGTLGTLLLTVALACLPVSGRWPLPTGLGGAVGDLLLRLPAAVTGAPPSAGMKAVIAIVIGAAALALLVAALASRPMAETTTAAAADFGPEGEEDGGVGRFAAAAGAAIHVGLAVRASYRRLARRIGWARRLLAESDAPAAAARRAEPGFRGEFADIDRDMAAACWDEMDEVCDIADDAETATRARTDRIRPAASRPKPGKRAAREAQTSFLDPDAYELPPLHLLSEPRARRRDNSLSPAALEHNARLLEGVLDDFGVRGEIINIRPGPVVTLYELEPAPGTKSSRVIGLADDIARSMSAIAARVAVIPGRNVIGIELPNGSRETVYLREILAAEDFEKSKARLALTLGKTIGGEPVIADLARMPHLLVAGTTGSGKSVSINTMILSLLYRLTPQQCRLIMIDPKMLELSVYDGIPHLLTPVVTDPKKAVVALKWTVREMEERYKQMSKLGVRNIDGFNQRVAVAARKGEEIKRTIQVGFDHETGEAVFETEALDLEPMPYIVVIIDEMADLMMVAGKDIEGTVQRLAQMARAAGIHVIMATQRPSVDVITGTIKANFPTRISFQVTSKIDSRTILGEQGAEQLLGMGDMLFMAGGGRIQRVHGPFVDDDEVEEVVAHLKSQGVPEYLDAITDEEEAADSAFEAMMSGGDEATDLYDKAVAIVLHDRKVSTSYIQRRLSIGYNRAASIVERMEQEGVVSPANHAGKREILVPEREGAPA